MGDRNCDIFPVGTIFIYDFNAFHDQRLNYVFSVHTFLIHTAHDYFIIVTHTLHLSAKKRIIVCFVMRDCYYLPPLSQLRFLLTDELSAYTVVLCSETFVTKKSTLKSRLRFLQKSNRDQNLKKQNCDHTN